MIQKKSQILLSNGHDNLLKANQEKSHLLIKSAQEIQTNVGGMTNIGGMTNEWWNLQQ